MEKSNDYNTNTWDDCLRNVVIFCRRQLYKQLTVVPKSELNEPIGKLEIIKRTCVLRKENYNQGK